MGALEAYLGAALFHLFGPSLFSLRLGLLILFILFLVSTYLLASLLYSKSLALVTIAGLSIGSSYVLGRELSAIGGYPETLLFGSLAFLCASWLVLSYRPNTPIYKQGWRFLIYAGWGLAAGLGLWSDLLVLPFIVVSGFLILLFCWRELLHLLATLCILLGFAIGAYPLISYNLRAAPGEDSFTELWLLAHGGSSHLTYTSTILIKELTGTIQVSIPMMTGNPFCPITELSFLGPSSPHSLQCTLAHSSWGIGYLLLLAISLIMTLWLLGKALLPRGGRYELRPYKSQPIVRNTARLMLLASALLALGLYAFSAAPIDWPGIHARYVIGLLIATPAILWPLWCGIQKGINYFTIPSATILACISLISLLGTGMIFTELPSTQATNQQQQHLISHLISIGATHIYTDYWTCDSIAFISNERIICGVVDGNLQPSHNRDAQYYTIVNSDPHSAYVFPIGSSQLLAAQKKVEGKGGTVRSPAGAYQHYQRFNFDGYTIYIPL
jgi:hypothetical protein